MPILQARTLVTAIGTIAYPEITLGATGSIEDISSNPKSVGQGVLTPTFFDIHTHGAAGHDVMTADREGFGAIGRFLASHGTSHYLATTATAPLDQTLAALDRIADAIERPEPGWDEALPVGVHLEGPFLAHGRRGVHPAHLLEPPSPALFERMQQAARGHIRLLTLAPELAGALELIGHATATGVRVSVGHTDATAAETRAALAAGALSATHTFNAMRPLHHREPGVLGVVLDSPGMYAELICDLVHVAPELVRLWFRSKADRAILVTDSMAATGMPDGAYTLAGLPVTLSGGRCLLTLAPETLAGSVLTQDRAVANLMETAGCTLAEAVRAASTQPAAMLGLDAAIASVREGQPANFNRFHANGRLEATYLRGRRLPA